MQEAKQKLVDDLKQREADLMKQNERLQKIIEEQWKGTQEPKLLSDDEFQKAWRDISFRWNKKKINDKDESFDPDTSLETILAMETTFQKHAETTEDKRINLKDIQRTVQTMMFQLQSDRAVQTDLRLARTIDFGDSSSDDGGKKKAADSAKREASPIRIETLTEYRKQQRQQQQ